jgi:hypothetical protein
MSAGSLVRLLNPWKHRREQREAKLAALRNRDGDDCRRCRRPIRFDRPHGHDLAARFEEVVPGLKAEGVANLCLTHERCNVSGQDHTSEIAERLRPQREAELFAKARERRRAA